LREGRVALVGDGAGSANLLYIDNLCHAILRALDSEQARGETVVVSDPDSPTWRELYDAYASLGGWTVRTLPEDDYPRPSRVRAAALALSASPAVRAAARRVLGSSRERVRETLLMSPDLPSPELAALQTAGVSYSTASALRVLGYAPPVTFERGLRLTEEWLRFARLI
jgi:nucleoside-diphosphate-sugar epimerase